MRTPSIAALTLVALAVGGMSDYYSDGMGMEGGNYSGGMGPPSYSGGMYWGDYSGGMGPPKCKQVSPEVAKRVNAVKCSGGPYNGGMGYSGGMGPPGMSGGYSGGMGSPFMSGGYSGGMSGGMIEGEMGGGMMDGEMGGGAR